MTERSHPRSKKAFEDLDVDPDSFEKLTGFLFDPDEPGEPDKEREFADMLKRVLRMRGTNAATVMDIMEVNKHVTRQNQMLLDKLGRGSKFLEGISAGSVTQRR